MKPNLPSDFQIIIEQNDKIIKLLQQILKELKD